MSPVRPSAMPAESAATQPPPAHVECPRCGYDLRGAVHSWRESCPMEGRCAECGLDFEWWRLITHGTHAWLFEYHWRRRPIRSLIQTFARMCRPKRFWSSIDLTDPVHLQRAIILPLIAVVLPLLLRFVGAAVYLVVWQQSRGRPAWFGPPATAWEIAVHAFEESFWVGDGNYYSEISWLVAVPQVAMWWFALTWIPLTALCFRLIPVSLRRVRVRPSHIRRIAAYGVAWMTLPIILLAAIEMLASLANAATLWAMGTHLYWGSWWELPLTIGFVPTLPVIFAILTWWWWDCACRFYLRLPDGRLVALLLTLLSGLITLAGFVFLAEMLGEHGWWIDKL